MALANTASQYGAVAKTFHWLTALLIVTLIPLGIYANDLPYDTSEALAFKAQMFSLHKTLGVTAFFVALARIAWALVQPKPAGLHPERRAETWLADTVHWLLYGSLLLVPLSGWVHHAATTGFAPILWPLGQSLPLVPKSETLAAVTAGLHIVFERVLAVSILLHVAGALKHHFIDRDATLRRMLPGRPVAAPAASDRSHSLPLLGALAIWAGALAAGSALGLYRGEGSEGPAAAALAEVQSDWQVQEGTIAIEVRQFGADVTGSFADWTAEISFDPDIPVGTAGSVDVTISIGSLTLGSVTSQALGADFFNAAAFPTARFAAEIQRAADGYEAVGTLTIKDRSVPVRLPFLLSISDGVAQMEGRLTLDRRDFAIGDNMPDEASLGFPVETKVALTARKAGG